jgi:Golgi phosphoprotein 3
MLTLAEEAILLALDEETGTIQELPLYQTGTVLVASVLMELALLNRVDTDVENLQVISNQQTGEPILDRILSMLPAVGETRPIRLLVERLSSAGDEIKELALKELVEKGILKEENRRFLWVFKTRRYPMIDNREVKEVEARLHELLLGDEIPDPRDVVLVSLANTWGLFDQILSPRELKRATPRIRQLAKLDLIGQQAAGAIQDIMRAMASAQVPV